MSIPFLSFIEPIFAWNVPLVSLIFLKRSLVFPILLFSSVSTVEVRNIFKGLDLIESAWRTMDGGSWHCTRGSDQDNPQEKEMEKAKWLSEEALQIAEKIKDVKGKWESKKKKK